MAKLTLTLKTCAVMSAITFSGAATAGPETEMTDALPQTALQETYTEPAVPSRIDYFTAADLDWSDSLTPEEYAVFVDTLAARGDIEMQALQAGDLYVQGFAAADSNADGLLTDDEVPAAEDSSETHSE